MKAPEEYLEERQRHVHYEGTDAIYYFEERETLKALKSMQEDAEKELIEFVEWIQENGYSKYWGSDGPNCGKWYKSYTRPDREYYTTAELLTQFRNKQQDK